jgi:hypothetical protein
LLPPSFYSLKDICSLIVIRYTAVNGKGFAASENMGTMALRGRVSKSGFEFSEKA